LIAISLVESSCLIHLELDKTNGSQDESNMNSLQKKWQARGIKHELSTKQMAVKTNQT
jgi:predicted class III extradiol MEMO1 family dioxygenase